MKKIIILFIALIQSVNGMQHVQPSSDITFRVTLFRKSLTSFFEAHTFCPQCKKTYNVRNKSDTNALLYVQACLALHMLNKHNINIF
ncbi:MAG: hypothetical protein ACD_64C00229G0002 [uncultured bacterium]|nr:MAG: hypothetical protein ACD_64C00229G0002 [uncultured bacterium]